MHLHFSIEDHHNLSILRPLSMNSLKSLKAETPVLKISTILSWTHFLLFRSIYLFFVRIFHVGVPACVFCMCVYVMVSKVGVAKT